jgi:hypothetical protein
LHYFSVLAETCLSLLGTAHPLHTIFGPYYRPETVVEQRIRSLLPSPIRPKIPGTSIGIRMERQQYFTNPILREELMKLNNVRSRFPTSNQKGWMPDHVGPTQATSSNQQVRERRQQTIAKVESSIRSYFGQEFRIGAFGSTQYGVDGQNSDLDLVVIVRIFLMFHF